MVAVGGRLTRHVEVVSLVLEQPDIDIDAKNEDNETAMYFALFGDLKIVEKLLERGANVNCRIGMIHDSYLMVAVRNADEDLVSLLL